MRASLFLLFILLLTVSARAQYYNSGTEPVKVKWHSIKTEKFTIIYPREIDSIAQRYAWLFDKSYKTIAAPLQADLLHTPVVLHPYNIYSNGMVSWAPHRMELMTTPPIGGYAQMWDKQLVLHETRHVAQMSKLRTGFFKYLYYIIGEQSEGLAAGLYLPNWFLEGDATVSETAGSSSGRGRQPEFLMPIKALLLEGNRLSWDTWLNGSYKYYVPNQYQLGYVLSSYAYKEAGVNIFGKMLDYTTFHPLNIPPPSRALKKYGGFDDHELFNQSFDYLKKQWQHEDSTKNFDTNFRILASSRQSKYIAYRSAVAIDKNTTIAVRSDLEKPVRLVVIDNNGNEESIHYIGAINSRLKKQGDSLLYWTASVPHERWEQVSYSILRGYDIRTGRTRNLTSRSRYFSPAPSPDDLWIAVVENTPEGKSNLVLLDTKKYRPEHVIPAPSGNILKELTWDSKTSKIYCTMLSDNGISLQQYDMAQQKWASLLPVTTNSITRLVTFQENILFESGYDGTNNIYAFDTKTGKTFQVTNARFGAFDPAISTDNSTLLYSSYATTGYDLVAAKIDKKAWKEATLVSPEHYELADAISNQVHFNIDTVKIPSQPMYKSERYNRLLHAFNIHSWAPIYFNPDELLSATLDKNILEQISVGATVLSQNVLGTLTSRLGYQYKNGFNSGHLAFKYRGWYPVFDFNLDVNERYRVIYDLNKTEYTTQPYVNLSLRAYIPFNLTRSAWVTQLIPQVGYYFSNDEYYLDSLQQTQYDQYVQTGVYFSRQLTRATRDIFPRWGYSLRVFRAFPVFSNKQQPVSYVQGGCYLPGFWSNHGILLTAGYQWHDDNAEFWYPSNYLKFPRGYVTTFSQRLFNTTFDYTLPLWYPDFNISWLVYIKRMRTTVFTDYALARQNNYQNMVSVGADFLIDFHFLRFGFPIGAGVRYAQPLIGSKTPTFSFLFDVSIY